MVYNYMGTRSQSYGASPAIWDYRLLPATRQRRCSTVR